MPARNRDRRVPVRGTGVYVWMISKGSRREVKYLRAGALARASSVLRLLLILLPSHCYLCWKAWVSLGVSGAENIRRPQCNFIFACERSVLSGQPVRNAIYWFYTKRSGSWWVWSWLYSLQDIYLKGFGKEYFLWKLCQLALASARERQPGEGCVGGRSGYALKKCKKAVNKISSKK